jgi:hypothetical protein
MDLEKGNKSGGYTLSAERWNNGEGLVHAPTRPASPATLPALTRWREGSMPQALNPTLPWREGRKREALSGRGL